MQVLVEFFMPWEKVGVRSPNNSDSVGVNSCGIGVNWKTCRIGLELFGYIVRDE